MNKPLEQRAGYNQGVQPSTLLSTKFAGQPGVKLTGPSTIIFRAAPVVPGESTPRAVGANPAALGGMIFNANGSGTPLQCNVYMVDPLGNVRDIPITYTIANGTYGAIWFFTGGMLPLLPGWSYGIKVTASLWQGVTIWPWSHDLAENMMVLLEPLSTTELVIGPPPGRAWQLAGNVDGGIWNVEGAIAYWNFDSVTRTVDTEKVNLAGVDFPINAAPVATLTGERSFALDDLISYIDEGFILAYPDTLKFKALENQTTAPLYLMATFAEFALPSDMG